MEADSFGPSSYVVNIRTHSQRAPRAVGAPVECRCLVSGELSFQSEVELYQDCVELCFFNRKSITATAKPICHWALQELNTITALVGPCSAYSQYVQQMNSCVAAAAPNSHTATRINSWNLEIDFCG